MTSSRSWCPLLDDPEAEVRARPPRCWARPASQRCLRRLIGLLADASARVRFFAAIAMGKLGRPEAVGAAAGDAARRRR